MMHVLLAGGGTAGHVEPALNLAEVLRERDSRTRLTFMGTSEGLETRLVPPEGYPLELIEARALPRHFGRNLAAAPRAIRSSTRQVKRIIDRLGVSVVVGFGSYVALPAYLAARGRAAIVVHEANAKPGLANRVGAYLTPFVGEAYRGSLRGAQTIGIPLRPVIGSLDRGAERAAARKRLGLDADRPCVLVFGGSQGARRVNSAVVEEVPALVDAGLQVLHAYGANNSDQVATLQGVGQPHYVAVDYLSPISDAYSAADLAVCRAGALTCAELAAVGLPAIYVPFPIGNGEQRLNAAAVVDAGGGLVIDDSDLSGDRLGGEIARIMGEPGRLARMGAAAAKFGVRDGGRRLADMVEQAEAAGPGRFLRRSRGGIK